MTAGQRNCYIEICKCIAKYSMDDVLFAVVAQIKELSNAQKPGSAEKRIARDAAKRIDEQRHWLWGCK